MDYVVIVRFVRGFSLPVARFPAHLTFHTTRSARYHTSDLLSAPRTETHTILFSHSSIQYLTMEATTSANNSAVVLAVFLFVVFLLPSLVREFWRPVMQFVVSFVCAVAPCIPSLFVARWVVIIARQINGYLSRVCPPPVLEQVGERFPRMTPEEYAQALAERHARKEDEERAERAASLEARGLQTWARNRAVTAPPSREAYTQPTLIRDHLGNSPLAYPPFSVRDHSSGYFLSRQPQQQRTTLPVPPPYYPRELFTKLPPSYQPPSSIKSLATPRLSSLLPSSIKPLAIRLSTTTSTRLTTPSHRALSIVPRSRVALPPSPSNPLACKRPAPDKPSELTPLAKHTRQREPDW